MQQLAKSMGSFTWAMSLFGMQQTMNMVRPVSQESGAHPATEAFRALTDATVNQLGATTQKTFQTVDGLQRQMLDVGFSFLKSPSQSRDGSTGSLGELAQKTALRFQDWGNSLCPKSGFSETTGWGPVPTSDSGAV